MYSYEDRIRAVTLYIKLGKRTGATIRQLGYPTKNSLKSWHEEYERRLDLSSGYVRSKPKYSQIHKQQAVKHYAEHGRCIASTVKALGYPCRDLLRAWIDELDPNSRQRIVGRAVSAPRPPQLKKLAVLELCTREGSAQVVAQKLGVSRPTLYNWKNQLLGREAPASMKHTNQSPRAQERDELEREVEALRREVRQLRLEQDLLNKANELLKKGLGVDLQLLSNREKTLLIDALKGSPRFQCNK
ncbi:IS3 family transposase ISBmu11 [Ottowia pentelensis]